MFSIDAYTISYEEYYPFGNSSYQAGRSLAEVSRKRYRYVGKERDEASGFIYIGARYYCPWLARWLEAEPLESKYAPQSPYCYCSNNPVTRIDETGMGDKDKINTSEMNANVYLDVQGNVMGYDENKKDNRVFVADSIRDDCTFVNALDLNFTQQQFAGFASLVYDESGGNKEESFAIANVTINFINNGGTSALNSLEAILLKPNSYSFGVSQKHVDTYAKLTKRNTKSELAAVINSLGHSEAPDDSRFSDNTNGATHWDGLDLVVGINKNGTINKNSHRSYTWSNDSKDILKEFYDKYGVDSRTIKKSGKGEDGKPTIIENIISEPSVNVSNWAYAEKGFGVSAKTIIGKSLFQKIANPGEGYLRNAKNVDYSKLKIF